jgi:hypothetical protein
MEGAGVEDLFANSTADWNENARLWMFARLETEPTNDERVIYEINQEIWEVFAADGPFGMYPSMMWFFSTPEKIVSPLEFLYFWSFLTGDEMSDIEARVMMVVAFGT